MMSVFRLIPQHQFLFLCYMLPTWKFGSVNVCESESGNGGLLYVVGIIYLKDHSGSLGLGLFCSFVSFKLNF